MKIAGALWLVAFLLWLPLEDTHIWLSLTLAAAGSTWLGLRLLPRSQSGGQAAVLGGLLGAATPLLAITLMAIKGGLHGHGFADFSARQVWAVVALLPIASVFGSLAGIGARQLGSRSKIRDRRPLEQAD